MSLDVHTGGILLCFRTCSFGILGDITFVTIPILSLKPFVGPITIFKSRKQEPSCVDWFSEDNVPFHAALLVAGSRDYQNYRHQADICHAYQLLRKQGIPDENIITFVYDDIAYNWKNPYKGKIFNAPGYLLFFQTDSKPNIGGENVYPGCAKDYTGIDVTKENILAALTGDAKKLKGIGSGRALKADPKQRIAFVYSDHGSVGSIGTPNYDTITARQLNKAIKSMLKQNFFNEMVIYMESCEAGSMFKGFEYKKQYKILPIAAALHDELSYATYCPGDDGKSSAIPNPAYVKACLGDLFTVSWLEYTESHDVSIQTIREQLDATTKRTSKSYSYTGGSHVSEYGPKDNPIQHQVIGNFLSYYKAPTGLTAKDVIGCAPTSIYERNALSKMDENRMTQYDADLVPYLIEVESTTNDLEAKDAAMEELQQVLSNRRKADETIRSVVRQLIQKGQIEDRTEGEDEWIVKSLPREEDLQVVDDWDAFEAFIEIWKASCVPMSSYALQHTRCFSNLINAGVTVTDFAEALDFACQLSRNVTDVKLEFYVQRLQR